MFRPPYLARVAAGAAVYALEESRRLPTAAMNFPITAISQLLQTTMHVQQFVTSLALKGDAVFDRLGSGHEEQPEWATFEEDLDSEQTTGTPGRASSFDLFTGDEPTTRPETNGHTEPVTLTAVPDPEPVETEVTSAPIPAEAELTPVPDPDPAEAEEVLAPEVATRYDYANMTLAQLRARLRMLSVEDLTDLLDYEQRTLARAPFVTMLTNRIATVRAQ
ncbi:lipid droplet-associated protein [Nocardia takedensis]